MTEMSPVEAIFAAALEKSSAEERAAYLDSACGRDGELRDRVERLIAAHPKVGSFLEQPAIVPAATSDEVALFSEANPFPEAGERAGSFLAGRYRLVEEIGE